MQKVICISYPKDKRVAEILAREHCRVSGDELSHAVDVQSLPIRVKNYAQKSIPIQWNPALYQFVDFFPDFFLILYFLPLPLATPSLCRADSRRLLDRTCVHRAQRQIVKGIGFGRSLSL